MQLMEYFRGLPCSFYYSQDLKYLYFRSDVINFMIEQGYKHIGTFAIDDFFIKAHEVEIQLNGISLSWLDESSVRNLCVYMFLVSLTTLQRSNINNVLVLILSQLLTKTKS